MKKSKILLGALVAIFMVALLSVTAMAATVTPGGSTTVSMTVSGLGADCSVSASGSSSLSVSDIDGSGGDFMSSGGLQVSINPSTFVFWVTVTASADARVGDSIDVTFTYTWSNNDGPMGPYTVKETVTVVSCNSIGSLNLNKVALPAKQNLESYCF